MSSALPGMESIPDPNTVYRNDPIKSHDPEINVTYHKDFMGLRVDYIEGVGFKAWVKIMWEPPQHRIFSAQAYAYTEAKHEAFRQAAEALGI